MKAAAATLSTLLLLAASHACGGSASTQTARGRAHANSQPPQSQPAPQPSAEPTPEPLTAKVIHVFVALCDNVNQGIVPVSASLGNGDDPPRNLYWGARFGVRTFYGRSRQWRLVAEVKGPRPAVLERVVFRHRTEDAYLVADAYRGAEIAQATYDFLEASAGASRATFADGGKTYGLDAGARSHLAAYVGHNGLMDFKLHKHPRKADDARRDAVVLACASKGYFAAPLREAGAHPLLWTTNLMAPEAYVLDAAVEGWLRGEDGPSVRERAARAYHAYQNCGLNAARRLFASGW